MPYSFIKYEICELKHIVTGASALHFSQKLTGAKRMKFLKSLLNKDKDETPTWDIKPEAERPAPRKRRVEEKPLPPADEEPNPFLDATLDTMQLEQLDVNDDDPYQSYSWQLDPENDTRKLKTIQIGEAGEKDVESEHNPYDTGILRRGWKK